jgi:hypothetical protein
MVDTALMSKPTANPAKEPKDKRERISPRLRHGLDLMVWGDKEGHPLDWDAAARAINVSTRSMRKSLERPMVRAYLREQKQVLRSCISAKSLWRLDEITTQRSNMNAAVNAIKAIDEGDELRSNAVPTAPFVTINIVSRPQATPIDVSAAPVIVAVPRAIAPEPEPADPTVFRPKREDW